MTDPRLNDPNYPEPPLVRDRQERAVDRTWAWIAGIAALVLIGFIVAAGWNSDTNTASNQTPPATTSSPAPTTTGQAPAGAQRPAAPAPSGTPAPAPSGNR